MQVVESNIYSCFGLATIVDLFSVVDLFDGCLCDLCFGCLFVGHGSQRCAG